MTMKTIGIQMKNKGHDNDKKLCLFSAAVSIASIADVAMILTLQLAVAFAFAIVAAWCTRICATLATLISTTATATTTISIFLLLL